MPQQNDKILDLETPPSPNDDQKFLLPPWGHNGQIIYIDSPSTPGHSPYNTITSRPQTSPGGSINSNRR